MLNSVDERTPPWGMFKLMLYGYVVFVCCVGIVSLDVACDELSDYAWMLQMTHPTRGGAVKADTNCWANCAEISRRNGAVPHKNGLCRDKSRFNKHTQTSLDLRYLPLTNNNNIYLKSNIQCT